MESKFDEVGISRDELAEFFELEPTGVSAPSLDSFEFKSMEYPMVATLNSSEGGVGVRLGRNELMGTIETRLRLLDYEASLSDFREAVTQWDEFVESLKATIETQTHFEWFETNGALYDPDGEFYLGHRMHVQLDTDDERVQELFDVYAENARQDLQELSQEDEVVLSLDNMEQKRGTVQYVDAGAESYTAAYGRVDIDADGEPIYVEQNSDAQARVIGVWKGDHL